MGVDAFVETCILSGGPMIISEYIESSSISEEFPWKRVASRLLQFWVERNDFFLFRDPLTIIGPYFLLFKTFQFFFHQPLMFSCL